MTNMQINALAAFQKGEDLKTYTFDPGQLQNYDCLIEVLACGICHSDIHMIDNDWGVSRYPLVPGHEVIGKVIELGSEVKHLKIGDRVGVGWQMSSCLQCPDCLKGNENLCNNKKELIVHGYGGFANYLQLDSRFVFPIPAGIATEDAGPLVCGGITVYSALRYAGMSSGQEIGVIGVGGLGHMAVQFASKLGNKVTVFTTSQDKAEFAQQLGASHVIVVPAGESPPAPTRLLDIIISTVPHSLDWAAYLEYLNSDSTFTIVGVPKEPINLSIWSLLLKRRRFMSSPIGGRAMIMEMLSVADRFGIKPIVETFPLQEVNEVMQKVRDNKVRYRAVLTVS